MKRRVRRARTAQKTRPSRDDQNGEKLAYFYLIKHTDKGTRQNRREKEKGQNDVAKFVKGQGGACALYLTRGGPFDYVSVMTGLSPAAAIRVVAAIESRGTVKATLMIGAHLQGSVAI